jgi:hypothetical protein
MIAGHFGFAAAVKKFEPRAPLWALMLATVWLDVLFVPLFLANIESLESVSGTTGGYGQNVIHADYTHSLFGSLVLSAVFGCAFAAFWGRRIGWVLGAVVFSHWVLDLLVHRADLPLLPGDAGHFMRLGFGLWKWPEAAAAVELLLVAAGSWLYFQAARAATSAQGSGSLRARLVSVLILLGGVAVLALDV